MPEPASQAPADFSSPSSPACDAEYQYGKAAKNVEQQIVLYKKSRTEEEKQKAVYAVVFAMTEVANNETDPTAKKNWQEKANKFGSAAEHERDDVLKEIVEGLLGIVTAPFLVVGAIFQATGEIIIGVGMVFRGVGRGTQKLHFKGSRSRE